MAIAESRFPRKNKGFLLAALHDRFVRNGTVWEDWVTVTRNGNPAIGTLRQFCEKWEDVEKMVQGGKKWQSGRKGGNRRGSRRGARILLKEEGSDDRWRWP